MEQKEIEKEKSSDEKVGIEEKLDRLLEEMEGIRKEMRENNDIRNFDCWRQSNEGSG